MHRRLLGACLAWVVVFFAPAVGRGDLAWHLDRIELDRLLADSALARLDGRGQAIAVLDTGVDTAHVCFDGRAGVGVNFAADTPPRQPDFSDGMGHGTQVASIAAGRSVTISAGSHAGTTFQGPASRAGVVSVRVLASNGSGSFSDILEGLHWVRDHHRQYGIGVVNLSLGTARAYLDPQTLIEDSQLAEQVNAAVTALRAEGIVTVAAGGNAGAEGLSFPAILEPVVSVGATGRDDALAGFSNRSARLDMVAPGDDIWGATFLPSSPDVHGYATYGDGTSFASPLVAGAVLLVRQAVLEKTGRFPSAAEVEAILKDSAAVFDRDGYRYRRLDVYAAVTQAAAVPEPASMWMALLAGAVALKLRRSRLRR